MTRTIRIASTAGFLALGTIAWAQLPPSEVKARANADVLPPASLDLPAGVAPALAITPVQQLLGKRVDVDWDARTLESVLDWLREQVPGVNVVARWNALGVYSVDPNSEITLRRIKNVPLANVLSEALDSLTRDDPGKIRFRGVGNTLVISTDAEFNRKLFVRVYNVTDVIIQIRNYGAGAPSIDINRDTGGGGGGGGVGGGGGGFGGGGGGGGNANVFTGGGGGGEDDEAEDEGEIEHRMNLLADIIRRTISPESWDGEAGGKGTIQVIPDRYLLIVRNTIEVHEEIGGVFSFGD